MIPRPIAIARMPATKLRALISPRQPDFAPACIVFTRSPAAIGWGCLGLRAKIRRYHGSLFSTTTCAATRLVPHRRQNLRDASLASPQLPQIRSPG